MKLAIVFLFAHSPSVTYGGRARKCKSDVVILKYKIFYTQFTLKSLQKFQIFTKSFQKDLKEIKKGLPPPQKRGAKATKIYKNANRRRKNAVFFYCRLFPGVSIIQKNSFYRKNLSKILFTYYYYAPAGHIFNITSIMFNIADPSSAFFFLSGDLIYGFCPLASLFCHVSDRLAFFARVCYAIFSGRRAFSPNSSTVFLSVPSRGSITSPIFPILGLYLLSSISAASSASFAYAPRPTKRCRPL